MGGGMGVPLKIAGEKKTKSQKNMDDLGVAL